jgi:hypothetical protein
MWSACNWVGVRSAVDVLIINKSGKTLHHVQAVFGAHTCRWGVVVEEGTAGVMLYPHPITSDVDFQWTEAGKDHKRSIDLRGIYPPGTSGRLTFICYEGRTTVEFVKQ